MVGFWALVVQLSIYQMVRRMDRVRRMLPLMEQSLVGRLEVVSDEM